MAKSVTQGIWDARDHWQKKISAAADAKSFEARKQTAEAGLASWLDSCNIKTYQGRKAQGLIWTFIEKIRGMKFETIKNERNEL